MINARDIVRRLYNKVQDRVLYRKSIKWLPSSTYAQKFNAKWHKVYDRSPNKRRSPVCYGSTVVELQHRLEAEFPELGVLELNNAFLYGRDAWVFSKEMYLLPEHSWYGHHVQEMGRLPRFLPNAKYLKGVCLSLASDFAISNYGHFVMDCLSRLDIFYKAGFHLSDVDYIVCPKPMRGTAQFLFDQLGIPLEKCIWLGQHLELKIETLLAPSFPGTRRNYPSWVPSFLQTALLPPPPYPPPTRRLYISRSGCSRNIENEDSVYKILQKYGFEIYNPREYNTTHYDFLEAQIIVGAHGSGLTDIAFCQPKTKVLELVPTDHVYPYYYTLSDAANLEYGCFACRSIHHREPNAWGPSLFNFYVNEEEFDMTLGQLTS